MRERLSGLSRVIHAPPSQTRTRTFRSPSGNMVIWLYAFGSPHRRTEVAVAPCRINSCPPVGEAKVRSPNADGPRAPAAPCGLLAPVVRPLRARQPGLWERLQGVRGGGASQRPSPTRLATTPTAPTIARGADASPGRATNPNAAPCAVPSSSRAHQRSHYTRWAKFQPRSYVASVHRDL